MTVRLNLYRLALEYEMISQLMDLRINVNEIRGNEIKGGFIGILTALGSEMDRIRGIRNNMNNRITSPIAHQQATIIDNLLINIQRICSEVDTEKNYCSMLRELANEMTRRHGEFGEINLS